MFQQESKVYIGVLVATVMIILLMISFLFLAVRYYRSRKKLHGYQVIAEIGSIEKERKRIAADLHDEIGSVLTYIKLKLSNMEVEGRAGEDIIAVRHKLNSMHDSLLAITNDLLPNSLERNGLLRTIEEYLHETEYQLGIAASYTIDPAHEKYIAPNIKIHLYRIVTELVQNTVKHAQAKNLCLTLSVKGNDLSLRYSDDGRGFDARKELRGNPGLGLKNISSRVEMLRGRLFFNTAKHRGVSFFIQIPLDGH